MELFIYLLQNRAATVKYIIMIGSINTLLMIISIIIHIILNVYISIFRKNSGVNQSA